MNKIVLKLLISFLVILNVNAYCVDIETGMVREGTKLSPSDKKPFFGEQLFQGYFTNKSQFRENPEYILKIGDIIHLTIWGAHEFEGDVTIDGQGNIFIPKVGVVPLNGVKNGELQATLEKNLQKTFNENVFVYANVREYQALSVYVSGSVKNVGLYDGMSSDSVLQFLDKAGGILAGEGSFRHIQVLRDNQIVREIDLYAFLLDGQLDDFNFKNGDTILVKPMLHFVEVDGDVNRPYIFELRGSRDTVSHIMKYTIPKPGVNRFAHIKREGMKEVSHDYDLSRAGSVSVRSGEKLIFTSNSHMQSFSIMIEGEHTGMKHISVAKGTSLYDVLSKTDFTSLSNIQSIQLFRASVANKQKELLETNIKDLELRTFTSASATPEEAAIRSKDAELITQFIERARAVEFKGQVAFSKTEDLRQTMLEDGDRIYIPRKTNLVTIQGEVNIPNTLTYKEGENLKYYIGACGGYSERADTDKVLLIKASGRVVDLGALGLGNTDSKIEGGDAILVLGKTDTKDLLLAKDLTQIIYQVAVGAAVVLKAF